MLLSFVCRLLVVRLSFVCRGRVIGLSHDLLHLLIIAISTNSYYGELACRLFVDFASLLQSIKASAYSSRR